MLNETKNFMPDAFDDLLLQSILSDYSHNPEIQKTIDMTANFIYSNPINITVSKEIEERFIHSSGKSIFLNLLLNKFVLFTLGIVMLGFISQNLLKNQNFENPQKSMITSVLADTSSKEKTAFPPSDSTIPKKNLPSLKIEKPVLQKSVFQNQFNEDEGGSPLTNFPKYYNHRPVYDEEFDEDFVNSTMPLSNKIPVYPNENYQIKNIQCLLNKDYGIFNQTWKRYYKEIVDKNYKPVPFLVPLYYEKPFAKGFENMTYFSYISNQKFNPKLDTLKHYLPESMNYYFDMTDSTLTSKDIFSSNANLKFAQPFYISNQEMSNQDYKEFLSWVARYNGIEKPYLSNIDSLLSLKEYLVYPFHNPNSEYKKRTGKNSINVLPNVKCWTTDFAYSFNEPMVTHYFTHPAYRLYPVIGVSYWQAMAYLDWLTWIWQSRIDAQNIPYNIDFDLPTAYEWELASKKILLDVNIEFMKIPNLCNLSVSNHNDMYLGQELGISWHGVTDKGFHSITGNSQRSEIPNYKSKVINMDCNVSEWLKEDYSANWLPYISRYRAGMGTYNVNADKLLLLLEKYFDDEYNDKNGKLVQGGNWYNKRVIDPNTDNADGMFAKVFIHPDSSHSTLGFRFVMHVHLKNEAEIVKKNRVLGRDMPKIDYSLLKNETKANDKFMNDPYGFLFIPMGSFHHQDSLKSVQAFYAMETEVNNLTWFLFLNYLIDNNREEDLKECLPNDAEWALKMNFEKFQKFPEKYIKSLPLSSDFIRKNNIMDLGWTNFAYLPVVGISKKAAQLFAQWMTQMSGSNIDFRLPTEIEYEWMAYGGLSDTNQFAWSGKFTRDYRGIILAKYIFGDDWDNAGNIKKPNSNYQQNSEFTTIVYDSIWVIPCAPYPTACFKNNSFGLFDMCGNVAEMVQEDGFTKGGSWASPAYFLRIKEREKWSGKPSDCVGFRLVMTYLGKPAGK